MTTTCATTHPDTATPAAPADAARDPVAAVLQSLDDLLTRVQVLSEEVAATRTRIADLAEERRVREALAALDTEGRTEAERQARLRLRLAADADYRHLVEAERAARRDLARLDARLWAVRMRAHATLALLRLAAGAADTGNDTDADTAVPTPDTPEDPS